MNIKELPISAVAAIGDAYYSLKIKEYLISVKVVKSDSLHKVSSTYLRAETQARIVFKLIEDGFFTEAELEYIYRGRNGKVQSKAKNAKMIEYKYATGFEAVIGYLYYSKDFVRIDAIINYVIGDVEC